MSPRVAGVRAAFPWVFAGLFPLLGMQGRAAGDGTPLYPGGPTSYEQVAVPDPFIHLLGVWEGPFRTYDLQAQAFRPYSDRLSFEAGSCIRVTAGAGSGDILLVGTMSDSYPAFSSPAGTMFPAKSETGYLIYGLKGGDPNQIFVRTVEGGGVAIDYVPEYALLAAQAFVYRAVFPAAGGQSRMTFRILDAQDSLADDDSRDFTLTLTIGPDEPYGGYDLRLMSWGYGSGVPTSGRALIIVGTDNNGLLHIRAFDSSGNEVTDMDETKLPAAQAGAISALKQQLPALLPPHALTAAEKAQVAREATAIVGYWQGIIAGGRQHHTPPGGTPTAAIAAPGRAPRARTAMDVHRAMEALQKHDAARRGARALISTIPAK